MSELSNTQRKYWEQQLEYAKKAVEVAERTLGIIAVKEQLNEHTESDTVGDNRPHPMQEV